MAGRSTAATVLPALLMLSAAIAGAAAAAEPKPACSSISPEMAEMLVDHWPAALAAGDGKRLGSLYARDAVVISPAHPHARATPFDVTRHADAMARTFLLMGPATRTLRTGCSTILEFGEMRLKQRGGGRDAELGVRYSRVYERRDGVWLVTVDHMTRLDGTGAGIAPPPAPSSAATGAPPATAPVPTDRDQLDALVREVSSRPQPQVAGMLIRPPQLAERPASPVAAPAPVTVATPAVAHAPPAPVKPKRIARRPDWRNAVFAQSN